MGVRRHLVHADGRVLRTAHVSNVDDASNYRAGHFGLGHIKAWTRTWAALTPTLRLTTHFERSTFRRQFRLGFCLGACILGCPQKPPIARR